MKLGVGVGVVGIRLGVELGEEQEEEQYNIDNEGP